MLPAFENFKVTAVPEFNIDELIISGKNEKQVLIVIQANNSLAKDLEQFLSKIMQAIGFKLNEDTLILKVKEGSSLSFAELSQKHQIQQVIVFGISPSKLGLNFHRRMYFPFQCGEFSFLFADDLNKIYEERQQGGKKMAGQLWNALKVMFSSEF